MNSRSVLVIGGAVADLSVTGADPGIFRRHSTPVEAIRLSPGGDAMNEAAVLARLGSRVSLLTLLGEDEMGDLLLKRCADWGIDTASTVRSANVPTSINLVLVDRDAQRRFVTVKGSSLRRLAPEHVLPAVEDLTGEELISFASLFVSPCFGISETAELFRAVKAKGCTLCADMTRCKNGETAARMAPVLQFVDLLFANEEEAKLLTGEDTPEAAAARLRESGAKTVVVKLGARGGYWVRADGAGYFPAVPARAVDTTGAGDTFAGALLHALSRGEPWEDCLSFAAAAASLCVEQMGCASQTLSREAVLRRMKKEEKPVKTAMTITYRVKNGIYVNMTNRCPCACTFCLRQNAPGVYGSDPLWLEREPTVEEICTSLAGWELEQYDEVVFCGYGEPTERLEDLLRVATWLKERCSVPIRINTNGLADLIAGAPTAHRLKGLVDTVSISLNTPDAEEYLSLVRPKFGEKSYQAMLDYARDCVNYVPHVVMTVVGEPVTSPEKQERCRALCAELGVTLRVRPYEG